MLLLLLLPPSPLLLLFIFIKLSPSCLSHLFSSICGVCVRGMCAPAKGQIYFTILSPVLHTFVLAERARARSLSHSFAVT